MSTAENDTDPPEAGGSDGSRPAEVVVGLIADPDLPAALADRMQEALPELLDDAVESPITWTVQVVHDPFEEMYPDEGRLIAKARERVRHTAWDLVVCVTDQPMEDESGVVVASIDTDGRVAVISLPALGGRSLRRRLQAVLVPVIAAIVMQPGNTQIGNTQPGESSGESTTTELRRRLAGSRIRVIGPEPGAVDVHIVRTGRFNTAHLIGGMVRANRPGRLLLGLSMAMAGALAGIAFGVLYSSIWTLAAALGPLRLVGLTITAITVMTVWIIVRHHLWERNRRFNENRDIHLRLRNASTLITVAAGAIAFFLAMFAVSLAAVALVIPPTYLATTLDRPVGVPDYLTIAIVATVLGTLAGAVGSGLEDEAEVQEAAYGYRESKRRQHADGSGHL